MLTEGLAYTLVPNTNKSDRGEDYYKNKCAELKERLKQFESENERLIEENCYLLDKNYQYTDTITVLQLCSNSRNRTRLAALASIRKWRPITSH